MIRYVGSLREERSVVGDDAQTVTLELLESVVCYVYWMDEHFMIFCLNNLTNTWILESKCQIV